ncbi:thiamine pyrophosphate-dependent enzyme [Streptomyces sp. NPDC012389]|uniref:thiamine pyrophosphate-dependent enzyme n=1 Tax=unclassified Streptomyces TaxID=2593676 RepID=UPI00081E4DDB|nr:MULTISPECIES: thiamine pyrophosphate-dependent enzyme [unclassified Streptomyces]MYR94414.1 transketolase [Streptomyces sp. SID4937]SCD71218.1 transketolase [Streptomyces sp. ScaeMP-e83]
MTNTTAAPVRGLRHSPDFHDLGRLISLMTGAEKHAPAAHSTTDALWVLYNRVLRVTPATADDPGRDRFLLSKGHGPMAYYAVLAAHGFFDEELLRGFGTYGSPLGHHPDRLLVPGAEIGSGSLGHGLPLAVGTALGLRAQGLTDPRVWVLVGDAELDEGSNHEAIAHAGPAGLEQLHTVVIDNASATHGWPGGIASRFEAAGWSAATVDGRDHDALYAAFTAPHPGRPRAVVARVEPKA